MNPKTNKRLQQLIIIMGLLLIIICQTVNYDQQSKLFQLMKLHDHLERHVHWLHKAPKDIAK